MKVILTTTIKKLGKIGDTVTVKPGFARNFLFPNNMALRENKKNIQHYEKIKDEMRIKEESKLNDAKKLIEGIKKVDTIDFCTYSNSDLYFSYRRSVHKSETDYGRLISTIMLET